MYNRGGVWVRLLLLGQVIVPTDAGKKKTPNNLKFGQSLSSQLACHSLLTRAQHKEL